MRLTNEIIDSIIRGMNNSGLNFSGENRAMMTIMETAKDGQGIPYGLHDLFENIDCECKVAIGIWAEGFERMNYGAIGSSKVLTYRVIARAEALGSLGRIPADLREFLLKMETDIDALIEFENYNRMLAAERGGYQVALHCPDTSDWANAYDYARDMAIEFHSEAYKNLHGVRPNSVPENAPLWVIEEMGHSICRMLQGLPA